MIDISIYDDFKKQKKGILYNFIKEPKTFGKFRIEKLNNLTSNYWALYSYDNTNNTFLINGVDDTEYLTGYCKEIVNKQFSSILICGLGLGIVPYIIKNFCSEIDVIENSEELILVIKDFEYLNGVNIINSDVYSYIPNKKYDMILLDIWISYKFYDTDCEVNNLVNKFMPFLNQTGLIYTPIKEGTGKTIYYYDDNYIKNQNTPPPTPTV